MNLSIIIVNYNTCKLLQACLASVYRETKDILFETIVVDNGSTDGSLEMLTKEFPQVKQIHNTENRGFAAACNQGIAISCGRYVLLLNSDTLVLDAAIRRTMSFMDANPTCGIAACRLLNGDGTHQPSCMSFPSVWNLFCEASFLYRLFPGVPLFGRYYMSHFGYDVAQEVDVVKGAFMLIRIDALKAVGGLDEEFFMYTEEVDLCYRVKSAGFVILFFPGAEVIHFGGGSTQGRQQFLLQLHGSQVQFIKKHFRGIYKWSSLIVKYLGIAVRIPIYGLTGLLAGNRELFEKSRQYLRVLYYAL